MIHIKLNSRSKFALDGKLVRQAAKLTLQQAASDPQSDLTIFLTDDHQLQVLNLQFLGIDRPTDVLSFPSGEADPQTGKVYLGDVIISQEQAAIQSEKSGHPVSSEIQLLTVHGILHLLGFDHDNPNDKKRMWQIQEKVLEKLGLPGLFIQETNGH